MLLFRNLKFLLVTAIPSIWIGECYSFTACIFGMYKRIWIPDSSALLHAYYTWVRWSPRPSNQGIACFQLYGLPCIHGIGILVLFSSYDSIDGEMFCFKGYACFVNRGANRFNIYNICRLNVNLLCSYLFFFFLIIIWLGLLILVGKRSLLY